MAPPIAKTSICIAVSKPKGGFLSGQITATAFLSKGEREIAKAVFDGQSDTPVISLSMPRKILLGDSLIMADALRAFEDQLRSYIGLPYLR